MFFNKAKNTTDTEAPKKRSVFGLLFNPEIGKSLQPLSETTSVFVQLIAMIFAMNGLFPKDHPAIRGAAGARLTLSEIFSTAWHGLSFTKAGLPKVVLFFAVSGTIVFAILSAVTALVAGFMGTAHAATTGSDSGGIFNPASNDLAQGWLDYIFKGQPLSDYYAQNGRPIAQSTGIQCSMITALGFYSNGMLVFAAIILFYHLVSMVVNTAHEGVPMGKRASQVWAPIRLVVAVGLLVPMGNGGTSCTYGGATPSAGLNAGQYIVIKMAELGSGLASQTWKVFVSSLSDRGNDYIQPSVPEASGLVRDVVLMEACRWIWNYHICKADVAGGDATQCADPNNYSLTNFSNEKVEKIVDNDNPDQTVIHYTPKNMLGNQDVCGSITIANEITPVAHTSTLVHDVSGTGALDAATIASGLFGAHKATFENLQSDFETLGAKIKNLLPELNEEEIPSNNDYTKLANKYLINLKRSLDNKLVATAISSAEAQTVTSLGWAGAGAWLNTIARDQGAIIDAYENGLPKAVGPDFSKMEGGIQGSTASAVGRELLSFAQWIDYMPPGTSDKALCNAQFVAAKRGGSATGVTGTPGVDAGDTTFESYTRGALGETAEQIGVKPDVYRQMKNLVKILSISNSPFESASNVDIVQGVFSVINSQAVRSGIWNENSSSCPADNSHFNLGAQLVTSNPLQEFSFWGHANVRAAFSLWKSVTHLAVAATILRQQKEVAEFFDNPDKSKDNRTRITTLGLQSSLFDFVAGIFSLFAVIFMMTGFTVAFVVPLLPYFRFFFNVLTWIVSTLEAIVAIPLVALAHLNPEGEGLPGQSAKGAYFLIFNIFVRPVMTIFGLIAGLIVFYVAIMLLNMTFAIAVAGTNAMSHAGVGYETLVRIAFTVTYGAAVYTCANNAFKTIGFFPEHAMRWIGQQAHHEKMGDGGRTVQAALGQTQGVLGEKALGIIRLKS